MRKGETGGRGKEMGGGGDGIAGQWTKGGGEGDENAGQWMKGGEGEMGR